MVGKSHDVNENKGTYFCYPTIVMKINELNGEKCEHPGTSRRKVIPRFAQKAVHRRQKAVGGAPKADGLTAEN